MKVPFFDYLDVRQPNNYFHKWIQKNQNNYSLEEMILEESQWAEESESRLVLETIINEKRKELIKLWIKNE